MATANVEEPSRSRCLERAECELPKSGLGVFDQTSRQKVMTHEPRTAIWDRVANADPGVRRTIEKILCLNPFLLLPLPSPPLPALANAQARTSSSDDDEHNMSNTLLLLFADALVAPALLADLREVDELMVALSCRVALGIFKQDRPHPEPDHLAHDPGCALWF